MEVESHQGSDEEDDDDVRVIVAAGQQGACENEESEEEFESGMQADQHELERLELKM